MASLSVRAVTAASNMARKLGQSLDNLGKTMEVCQYRDKLVPSTRFVAVDGLSPTVSPYTAFVAPNASVIFSFPLGAMYLDPLCVDVQCLVLRSTPARGL